MTYKITIRNNRFFVKEKKALEFILRRDDWIKIFDFYNPIWFLDREVNSFLKYPEKLGHEIKNRIYVFNYGSESAYILNEEIKRVE